jgi:hypothetical protein
MRMNDEIIQEQKRKYSPGDYVPTRMQFLRLPDAGGVVVKLFRRIAMKNYEKIKVTAEEVQAIMHQLLDAGVPMEQTLYEGWHMVVITVKEILTEEEILAEEEFWRYIEPFEQLIARRWAFQLAVAGLKELSAPMFPGSYQERERGYHQQRLSSRELLPYLDDPDWIQMEITERISKRILRETRKTALVLIDAGISLDHVREEVRRIVYELLRCNPDQEQMTYNLATEHLIQRVEGDGRLEAMMNAMKRRHTQ